MNVPPDLAGGIQYDLSGPVALDPLPVPEETYCLLDPATAQCSAAANANLANLVRLERHWATIVIECDSKYVQRNICLNRDLLALHEADLRGEAAGSALTALYQLAALEARESYLEMAIAENQASLDRLDQLDDAGLAPEVDRGAIAVTLDELRDNQVQLRFFRLQLNGQLQTLLACPSNEFRFYWPQIDWQTQLYPLDVHSEVAQGLGARTDLRGLGLVLCQLEKSTLRVGRGVLRIADEAAGSVEPTEGWIHKLRCICCNDHELDVRCQQLRMLYSSTEQLATAEIKNAVYKVSLQHQRVRLARQVVAQRQQVVDALLETRDVDDTSIFEISRARGRLFQAQSDLIDQVSSLKIAEVELRRVQGLLAEDCGYGAQLCCEGCCNGPCVRCGGKPQPCNCR